MACRLFPESFPFFVKYAFFVKYLKLISLSI